MKKQSSEEKRKRKRSFSLGTCLFCLLLAVIGMTGLSLSRFAASGSDSGGLRVADVELKAWGADQGSSLSIDTTNGVPSVSYQFTVSNGKSEAALEYSVHVELPEALPVGLTMELSYNGAACSPTQNGNTYTYAGGAELPAGKEENHVYTLTFTGAETLTGMGTYNGINVWVTAQQAGQEGG